MLRGRGDRPGRAVVQLGLDCGHTPRRVGSVIVVAVAAVVVVALVPLVGVELRPVHRFDVFAEGRGVRVALGAALGLARVRFLKKEGRHVCEVGDDFLCFCEL